MGKRIPEVTAYIKKQKPFAQPILRHLRELVHEHCPEANEAIKWGMPAFEYKGLLANMAAFQEHAIFGFWKDSLLREGKARLGKSNEKAMGSFGRLTSLDDLPADRTIAGLIKKAAQLNDEGVKSPSRGKAKPAISIEPPELLLAALRKNAKARETFDKLAPSHKRDYVQWISEAKTEATRQRRLQTAIEWMAEGKRRNWKYEKC